MCCLAPRLLSLSLPFSPLSPSPLSLSVFLFLSLHLSPSLFPSLSLYLSPSSFSSPFLSPSSSLPLSLSVRCYGPMWNSLTGRLSSWTENPFMRARGGRSCVNPLQADREASSQSLQLALLEPEPITCGVHTSSRPCTLLALNTTTY